MSSKKPRIRQKVDARNTLLFHYPELGRDEKLLDSLKKAVRHKIVSNAKLPPHSRLPTLYHSYRGNGFPVRNGNRLLPVWRALSNWLKVQISLLVLESHGCRHVMIKPDHAVVKQLIAGNKDITIYLRDRITRVSREMFGVSLPFYLIFEDMDKHGNVTIEPHAHGSILLPRSGHMAFLNSARARQGLKIISNPDAALKLCPKGAAGLVAPYKKGSSPNQNRSVNLKEPYPKIFNDDYADYVFKNVMQPSSALPDNRLVFSQALKSESIRFWELLRKGEDAIDLWPDLPFGPP